MTVDELKGLSNEKIVFECSKDTLLIKSQTCRYADFIKADSIESIERQGKDGVVISVPNGTSMGDHSICIDLATVIVVADGKTLMIPYLKILFQRRLLARDSLLQSTDSQSDLFRRCLPKMDMHVTVRFTSTERRLGILLIKAMMESTPSMQTNHTVLRRLNRL